ncbi:MAG: hypothetical protein ACXU82_05770 [Caulobacteraceae bacterium]
MPGKQPFLTVYDYGGGGVWAIVRSPDKKSIQRKYPILDVFDERPGWMSDDLYAQIAERHFYDIDDEAAGVLQFVLEDIQRRADTRQTNNRLWGNS